MTNYGNYDIPVFEDDLNTIKEFLRIALHTIFFHRWLGENNFEDVESHFSNINYVKLKNDELEKIIEANISLLEKNITKSFRAQVILNFYQKKIQKFYIMQELVNMWESWKFFFVLKKENMEAQPLHEVGNSKQKENKIREYLYYVLDKINDKFDFMPDFNIDNKEELPAETFPYEINAAINDSVFISLIKDMSIKNVLKDEI